jgi:aspartate/methionine/tyrosine aminotransferase
MAADPLFASDRVAFATLRARAWNHRWAVQPEGVIPLTAADPDFPVADEILAAMREYLRPGYLSYGPAEGLAAHRRRAPVSRAAGDRLRGQPDPGNQRRGFGSVPGGTAHARSG